MLRVLSCAAATVAALAALPCAAAPFAPKIDDVCVANPVPAGTHSTISPRRLVGFLFKTQGISDYDLASEPNAPDVGLETKISAIVHFDKFCTPVQHCTDGTSGKLSQAANAMVIFLQTNSSPVPDGQSGFQVSPAVGNEINAARLNDFLHGKGGSYHVTCVAAAEKLVPPKPSKEQQEVATALSGIVVRSKVSDLSATSIDKLDGANISFTSDYVAHTQTLTAGGVVGYQFPKSQFGDYSSLIPYFSYAGKRVNGTGASKTPDIGNVGGGLLGDFNVPVQGYYQNIQLSAQYLHSYVTDTDLLTGTVLYTPDFHFPGVGIAYNPNDGPIALSLKPQAKFVYGDVVHVGSNPSLIATSDYSRGGGRIELWLYGVSGGLQNFTFDSAYEYLKVWVGPYDAVWRWENTLSYNFPEQQNWSLQFKYSDGRNLDTLEREQLLTVGIGYKQ
jgi:hypothetical protein